MAWVNEASLSSLVGHNLSRYFEVFDHIHTPHTTLFTPLPSSREVQAFLLYPRQVCSTAKSLD